MGRRLDVRQIQLRDLPDRLEDRPELLAHAVDLTLGDLQAGQARHMENVFSGDRHLPTPV